jgi:RNA polymerase sigma-70 factor (ECF subfamily)
MLYGVIFRIVNNEEDAQNLLQDACIKIWQHAAHYDPQKGRLATWLINIARNTAIDFTRSKYFSQKRKIQNIDLFVVNETGNSASSIPVDIIGIRNMLHQLTPACRQVIEWMYFEGYTQQEIADNFNIPLGTVKSRARLALMELRTFFE